MRFYEAVTSLAIALLIIKLAHLASERPALAEGLGFPLLNELLVTLPDAMQSGEDASLGRFHAVIVGRELRQLSSIVLDSGTNGSCHLCKARPVVSKFVPHRFFVFVAPCEADASPPGVGRVKSPEVHHLHIHAIGIAEVARTMHL